MYGAATHSPGSGHDLFKERCGLAEVKRIYPEAKTALINYIEQHFHSIESYVFTCRIKDENGQEEQMTVYDVDSFVEALGMLESAKDTLCCARHDGDFKPRIIN